MKIKYFKKNIKRKCRHQKVKAKNKNLLNTEYWAWMACQQFLAYDLLAHESIHRKLLLLLLFIKAFFVQTLELRTIVLLFLVAKLKSDMKKPSIWCLCVRRSFLSHFRWFRHKKCLNMNVKIKSMKFAWIQVPNETILRINKEINGNGHFQWMRTQKKSLLSFCYFLIICFFPIDAFCQIRHRSNKTMFNQHFSLFRRTSAKNR